jgi:hypothetical protein
VAVDAQIVATKLIEALDLEDAPSAGLGPGGVAGRTIEDGLAKHQFGVEAHSLGAGLQGGREVFLHPENFSQRREDDAVPAKKCKS